MHQPVKDSLEEYLGGMLNAGASQRVKDHLAACGSCRRTVSEMREQAEWLRALRGPDEADPAPGFYARVMDRIESQRMPSIWSAMLEPVFAKRLAYASLALLLLLGTMVVSVDHPGAALEVVEMQPLVVEDTQPTPFGVDQDRDRDVVLVNLATYQY
ncbi:MAG: zf-HC2 domain-containing protein [Bryobacteraceae bacterium]|nr:zf-HC2 domain-containing protein [Bryobacteraceae bacterium]